MFEALIIGLYVALAHAQTDKCQISNCKHCIGTSSTNQTCRDCNAGYTLCTISNFEGLTLCYYGKCSKAKLSFNVDQPVTTCEECVEGYYGKRCDSKCRSNCLKCNKDTGECSLCKTGFYGNKCENCQPDWKGELCGQTCPRTCECNPDTGRCARCLNDYFGEYCQYSCPVQCYNHTCTKETGQCFACQTGYFGPLCNFSCPEHCLDGICDQESGICKRCLTGWFGYFCDKQCSKNRLQDDCDGIAGVCEACTVGLNGFFCNQTSSNSCTYRLQCEKNCPGKYLDVNCDWQIKDCIDTYRVCFTGYGCKNSTDMMKLSSKLCLFLNNTAVNETFEISTILCTHSCVEREGNAIGNDKAALISGLTVTFGVFLIIIVVLIFRIARNRCTKNGDRLATPVSYKYDNKCYESHNTASGSATNAYDSIDLHDQTGEYVNTKIGYHPDLMKDKGVSKSIVISHSKL